MTDTKPDILIASALSAELEAGLAARFTLHRDRAAAASRVRAIVGGGMTHVDAELIAALPVLEIVAIHGVGHDGIDLDAVRARNIAVTLTPDVLTDDVADLAIGLLLAVQRRIVANHRAVRDGGWAVPLGRRASGRRIGIYGMGRIGQAIGRRAAPFASEILYTSRSEKSGTGWRFVPDLLALAGASDILIIAAPGGADTAGAVNAPVLAALGEDGVLVNIARGSIVDQAALVDALGSGRIAGAGLDVFASEPEVPEALAGMAQVVLSPHQGSATQETRRDMAALVIANLEAHFSGRALITPLN